MTIWLAYISNILLIAFICYLGYRRYKQSCIRMHYWPALVFKVTSGLMLGLLFFQHYQGGDTITYYQKAESLSRLDLSEFVAQVTSSTIPSQPVRAIYFVRLVAIVKWITHADYWLLSIYFSLFSFLGSIYLVDKLSYWKSELHWPALISFLYFPSVVFWSAGLLKESLVFGALTFMLGTYVSWYSYKRFHAGNFVLSALAFVIIVSLKYYIGAVLIPILLFLTFYHHDWWVRQGITNPLLKAGLLMMILAIPMTFFFSWLSPNLDYSELWQVMQENHDKYIQLSPDGALYTLTWFEGAANFLINIPYLWFSGIFRPMIWEDFSFPAICSGFENTVLLISAIYGIYDSGRNEQHWTAEMLAIICYVSVLSVFLAFATPNFGTLARFKIYYMPFVILMICNQLNKSNLLKKD